MACAHYVGLHLERQYLVVMNHVEGFIMLNVQEEIIFKWISSGLKLQWSNFSVKDIGIWADIKLYMKVIIVKWEMWGNCLMEWISRSKDNIVVQAYLNWKTLCRKMFVRAVEKSKASRKYRCAKNAENGTTTAAQHSARTASYETIFY